MAEKLDLTGTVIVAVTCRMPGNTRKIKKDQLQAGGASLDWIKGSKELVQSKAREAIVNRTTQFRRWLDERRVPGKIFKKGVYLIRDHLIEDVQDEFDSALQDIEGSLQVFLDEYEEAKAKAADELKELFSPDDYLTADEYRDRVGMKLNFLDISIPSAAKLGSKIYAEQAKAYEQEMQDMMVDVRLALLDGMRGLVEKLVDDLKPDATGDKKVIKDNKFNAIRKFLDHFEDRDITNFAEMRSLVGRAKKALAGVDVEALKSDGETKDAIAKSFSELLEGVNGLAAIQTDRKIQFSDEE